MESNQIYDILEEFKYYLPADDLKKRHVADVASVLQRRPGVIVGSLRGTWVGEQHPPAGGIGLHGHPHPGGVEGASVEATVRAGPFEHPGPVLVVRHDRHGRDRSPCPCGTALCQDLHFTAPGTRPTDLT